MVSPDGTISPPVAGVDALGVTAGRETGLFDLVLDPDFASNHRIYFTFFGFDRGMIGGIQVARATFDQAANALQRCEGDLQAPVPADPQRRPHPASARAAAGAW